MISLSRANVRFQIWIVGIGILLMAIKFTAYFLTTSNAIFTDALESIINVVGGLFALYSLILAAKPQDQDHPYGHGKVEYLSAGFEGGLILIAGIAIISKSVYNLFYPTELKQLDLGILLTAISGGVNYAMGFYLQKRGEKQQSLTMKAGGEHLKSDAYSTVGLLVGLGLIYFTRLWWLDQVVAMIFGGIILYTGARLVRKAIGGVMDEADYEQIIPIIDTLKTHRRPNWIDVHNLRLIKYGNRFHIDCHVTLPWYFSLKEAHEEVNAIEAVLNEYHPGVVELFIHSDPCLPTACPICQKEDCKVRQFPRERKIEWELGNVLQNERHAGRE